MIYPDAIHYFEKEKGNMSVYIETKKVGEPYGNMASPRKRKKTDLNVIRISPMRTKGKNKPDYNVESGNGTRLTGMYYKPEYKKGYGNINKTDVLLFNWDIQAGILKVLILFKKSENRTQDENWFNEWIRGNISEKDLFNRLSLGTDSETLIKNA